jgi:hypothetical protein
MQVMTNESEWRKIAAKHSPESLRGFGPESSIVVSGKFKTASDAALMRYLSDGKTETKLDQSSVIGHQSLAT